MVHPIVSYAPSLAALALVSLCPAIRGAGPELPGKRLQSVHRRNAEILAYHVPRQIQRMHDAGRAIALEVESTMGSAQEALKAEDSYRAYRLFARAFGLAQGAGRMPEFDAAAAFALKLNRAIFWPQDTVEVSLDPLYDPGEPLPKGLRARLWLETVRGVIPGTERTLEVAAIETRRVSYPAAGLPAGAVSVGYELLNTAGEPLVRVYYSFAVAASGAPKPDEMQALAKSLRPKTTSNQSPSVLTAMDTLEYVAESLASEAAGYGGHWRRGLAPFAVRFGSDPGRPGFWGPVRCPEDIDFALDLARDLEAGRDPLAHRRGDMRLAIRLDGGQLMSFRLFVPEGIELHRLRGLIVALHSGAGDHSYFEWESFSLPQGQPYVNAFKALAQKHGFLVACPAGYGTPSRFAGEPGAEIVMTLAHRIESLYPVPTGRTFLAGWSIGSSAAWRIALGHPERFAGLAAVGGEASWLTRESTAAAAKLPVLYVVGERDYLIQQARATRDLARGFLPLFQYKELANTEHRDTWSRTLESVFRFFEEAPPRVESQRPSVDVTYVANTGFMIQGANKKVLVDALFDTGFGSYLAPSAEVVSKLAEAREPFDGVDLILVTHWHGDHFNTKMVAAHLFANPRCRLVAHTQTVDRLRQEEVFAQIQNQIHELHMEPGARERMTINGVALEALCLPHGAYYRDGRNVHPNTRDLAFIVDLGGMRFLHPGDASAEDSSAYLNTYPFDTVHVDLMFCDLGLSEAAQQLIVNRIKPEHIVAVHVQPAELEAETKRLHAVFPGAVVFKESMERRVFRHEVDLHALAGDYLGQSPPGALPQVFAPGIVSTDNLEHSAAVFSPDGNEVYWQVVWPQEGQPRPIMTMRRVDGGWTAPRAARFDDVPKFSADGRKAYFTSRLPSTRATQESRPDIWVVERQDGGWGEPRCLGLVTRFPEIRYARLGSVAGNGALYFHGYAKGLYHDGGIYSSHLVGGKYTKPELLPSSINMPGMLNWTPFVAPDESYLLFSSNRRSPASDAGDLYICFRRSDGSWTDPVILPEPVNSARQERFPMLSPDGKYLFFTRPNPPHEQDVYWVSSEVIKNLRGREKAR
jgi:L-ascorbate metabolism protein UlaG (beta-lactamase superfamily)/pimeloyl-ACP methyl ester carboxylesterase